MVKKKKKYIEPQFINDKSGKPVKVYLTLEDYNALLNKFEKLTKVVYGSKSKKIN
ncbi:MAG: hypothetical protein WD055_03460 [Candidatus Dependentiae bacterium]